MTAVTEISRPCQYSRDNSNQPNFWTEKSVVFRQFLSSGEIIEISLLSNFILFSLDQLSALVRDGMYLNLGGDTSLLTESSRIHPDFFGKHIYFDAPFAKSEGFLG